MNIEEMKADRINRKGDIGIMEIIIAILAIVIAMFVIYLAVKALGVL